MSVSLTGITAGYGGTTVLRDVSLSVPTGSVVALLGPNGAGKTTLLRTACGSLTPERGATTVDGKDLTGAGSDRFAAAGVTLIPEGRGVFPSLTVEENLKLFAPPRGADLEPAYTAFPRLKQRRRQQAGTMSGGEQQMLALSRAYVRPSATVLLDEVSMGLAPLLVDEIFAALRDLADAGKSLLIVEQFATKALAMADVAYVLAGGRIVLAGEPCELDEEALSRAYLGTAAV